MLNIFPMVSILVLDAYVHVLLPISIEIQERGSSSSAFGFCVEGGERKSIRQGRSFPATATASASAQQKEEEDQTAQQKGEGEGFFLAQAQ